MFCNGRRTITFGNDDTIVRGLHFGIEGMQEHGKRVIVIPPHLALGSSNVPADSYVVYNVEIVAITKKQRNKHVVVG